MIVNFRAYEISRGARKLARTPTLIKKKHTLFVIFFIVWNTFLVYLRTKYI
jgi:F0F1-type ATP synthase membrane subunit c/vacuolar-type H+-ATPase subunit K